MTKFQKQMFTIAAAGALTAVTALPAMAFENEFHGMVAVKTFLGNFDNAGLQYKKETKTDNYTEQRTRIQYIAKASDDLKLVTHFEMNTKWGGGTTKLAMSPSGTYTLDANGGDIDTDGSNLVVKHAYLDFNVGKAVNVKLGQQAYKDDFKGLYADADLPMAMVTYKNGGYTLGLGYSRFGEATGAYKGDLAADLYVLENSFSFSKNTKVGFAYYLNADNSGGANVNKKINTFGLSGETSFGALNLSGFAAMQAGYLHNGAARTSYHGWAADVLAKMKVGSGSARAGFLFTSGDNNNAAGHDNSWQTLSASAYTTGTGAVQNSYNESGMMLLVRNTSMGGTSTDNYFRKPITNIALAHMGYDASLTEKLYMNGNVGFAWVPASTYLKGTTAAANVNGGDFMGTELNIETGYKLYKNLTLKAQAAYVMLGAAYKNTATTGTDDPANPWTMRLGAHYSF